MNSDIIRTTMVHNRLLSRTALLVGAAAVVGMGALTACGSTEKPAETSPSMSSPTATAPPSPTEKAVKPGSGAGSMPSNSFAPTVTARPAPTALPGNVITGG